MECDSVEFGGWEHGVWACGVCRRGQRQNESARKRLPFRHGMASRSRRAPAKTQAVAPAIRKGLESLIEGNEAHIAEMLLVGSDVHGAG